MEITVAMVYAKIRGGGGLLLLVESFSLRLNGTPTLSYVIMNIITPVLLYEL